VLKKLAAVLALTLTSFVVTPALVAPAQAADDNYSARVRTSCHVTVPAVVSPGSAIRIRVDVRPNAPAADTPAARPTGSVTVSIRRGGVGIFSETVDYNGSPVTIEGPSLTEPGRYQVRETFRTADGSVYESCQGEASFQLASHTDGPNDGPGDGPDDGPMPNPGVQNPNGLVPPGVLPDTGGPNVVWLLLGLALVGGGGGLVIAARRRPGGSLYDV
jgi:LPXTG-motif cell wall-anchored protein